jgi:protein ImuB
MTTAPRALCVWCPAWAVTTARREDPALAGVPLAVVGRGDRGLPNRGQPNRGQVVCAASAEAVAEGVVPGLRRREAEARCAGLHVIDADPAAEARAFETVARATEAITPGIVLDRPGVLTFPTRGPSRYFGGDDALAEQVLEAVRSIDVPDARVGIADGAFAARLAARTAGATGVRVIEPSGTPEFVAPWPVSVLAGVVDDGADLAGLLGRLGLPTLGDLAALPASAVLARFGVDGARAHRLACGLEEHAAPPAPPPPDLAETWEFDPPAERVDEAVFAAKVLADQLLERLDTLGLACTQVVVEAETEHAEQLRRCWRHEGSLTPSTLVARVRWQLDAWLTHGGATNVPEGDGRVSRTSSECDRAVGLSGGLALLRLAPDRVVPASGRQLGFWGGDAAASDRAERALVRLQGMLGHDAVVTAMRIGGRAPSERVRWVPWGEPRDDDGAGEGGEVASWPGAIPDPPPARVHTPPLDAALLDADGGPVTVSGRGEASGAPALLRCDALPAGGGAVRAWAGPWAHDLRWWDRLTRRRRALWQVVVGGEEDRDAEVACLVVVEGGRAGIEAVYD